MQALFRHFSFLFLASLPCVRVMFEDGDSDDDDAPFHAHFPSPPLHTFIMCRVFDAVSQLP